MAIVIELIKITESDTGIRAYKSFDPVFLLYGGKT